MPDIAFLLGMSAFVFIPAGIAIGIAFCIWVSRGAGPKF